MTTKRARTYTYQCGECSTDVLRDRKLPADCTVSCGDAHCRAEVTRRHNEGVAAYRAALAEQRRARAAQPRQGRQPQALYGDFAQLAALNGVRTDGTGRRAR